MKQLKKIELTGTIGGYIWMPREFCVKHFRETFAPEHHPFTRDWTGLRDALLYICNDGDFQNCEIIEINGYAQYWNGKETITRSLTINPDASEISDLFNHDEQEIEQAYMIMDQMYQ